MLNFFPKLSNSSGCCIFIAQQIRSTVPIKFTATGKEAPLTFSNNRPGPPFCNMRLAISAISISGLTNAEIRFNCPLSSRIFINPRKSRAIFPTVKKCKLFLIL